MAHFTAELTAPKEHVMAIMSAQGSQVRLLIADDHTIFAQTLRAYLEKTFRVVGVVADGRALVDEAVRQQPDMVIVEVGMPLLNGFDAARRIKEQAPKIKFVFLTMQVDPNLAAAALELGPIGFVLKHGDESELLKAIDYVLNGKPYLTPKVRAEDWFSTKARARQFSKEMTQRQRDIVQLLAEGRPMKEIAGLLNLSPKTVQFHKQHIMQLFNLRTNTDLVLLALKEGLISLPPESPHMKTG